jgi:replication factor C subunit 1
LGSSSSALILARENGFQPVEMNASDVRSKKFLNEHISQMVGNRAITEFYGHEVLMCIIAIIKLIFCAQEEDQGSKDGKARVCLIMDEVDGMSGNADRGIE